MYSTKDLPRRNAVVDLKNFTDCRDVAFDYLLRKVEQRVCLVDYVREVKEIMSTRDGRNKITIVANHRSTMRST